MDLINCVLLIDDDQITNFINKKIVSQQEISKEIHTAYHGKEALNFLDQYHQNTGTCPELIFLDINMPVMDGFEFLHAFEKSYLGNSNKVVIVMLTTSINPGDIAKTKNFKIAAYLNKPLSEDKIKGIIEKHFPEKL